MNVHVERVWSNLIDVAGTCATLGTNVTITVNDRLCHRDGERFYCLLEVPNAAGAVETNITVLAVGGGLVRAASGTVYVAECDEAVTHADRGVIAADSRYAYEFDGFGRLISVTSSNAAPAFRLCFGYDADGRRAWKRVLGWTGTAWATNRTHAFVYDGWNLVAERITGSGTSTCFYTWGLDVAGQKSGKLGQEAGGIGGLLAITDVSESHTNVYFPLCDHIGTIRGLADTNGALVARYEYSPFGVLIRTWGSHGDLCSFRFSSKYYDTETELLYYGHRYYDPASTKWLSRDPIAERGGVNLTQFCHGDPVNRYDARGMHDVALLLLREDDKDGAFAAWMTELAEKVKALGVEKVAVIRPEGGRLYLNTSEYASLRDRLATEFDLIGIFSHGSRRAKEGVSSPRLDPEDYTTAITGFGNVGGGGGGVALERLFSGLSDSGTVRLRTVVLSTCNSGYAPDRIPGGPNGITVVKAPPNWWDSTFLLRTQWGRIRQAHSGHIPDDVEDAIVPGTRQRIRGAVMAHFQRLYFEETLLRALRGLLATGERP